MPSTGSSENSGLWKYESSIVEARCLRVRSTWGLEEEEEGEEGEEEEEEEEREVEEEAKACMKSRAPEKSMERERGEK